MSFAPRSKKDMCHCPTIYHYSQPAKPFCLQHTAEKLWCWDSYLPAETAGVSQESQPSTTLHVLCSSEAMKPGEVWKSSVSLQVDRLARLTRSQVSGYSSHDQSRFRPKFTAIPSCTFDLVGWQEEQTPCGKLRRESKLSDLGAELQQLRL